MVQTSFTNRRFPKSTENLSQIKEHNLLSGHSSICPLMPSVEIATPFQDASPPGILRVPALVFPNRAPIFAGCQQIPSHDSSHDGRGQV
jgi:hypothetical protein